MFFREDRFGYSFQYYNADWMIKHTEFTADNKLLSIASVLQHSNFSNACNHLCNLLLGFFQTSFALKDA